jgi:two-component system, cell cycle sensor histidine kinase and response regulator CckA
MEKAPKKDPSACFACSARPFRSWRGARVGAALAVCLTAGAWAAGPQTGPATAPARTTAPAAPAQKRVLLLNSYQQGFEWTDRIVEAAMRTLSARLTNPEFYVEYMDAKRATGSAHTELLREILEIKYADVRLDAIIASDDDALQFLLKYHDELFPRTPVVFCAVNDYSDDMLAGRDLFTGVVEAEDIQATIELAGRLRPGVRRVYVISDATTTGTGIRKDAAETARRIPGVQFEYLDGWKLSNQELLAKLAALPPDSIVLATTWYRDRTGAYLPYRTAYPKIAAVSPVPVYSLVDIVLPYGIVGGKLVSPSLQGAAAAEMAVRIMLEGKKPSDIPVLKHSPNAYMFNYGALQRFGIPLSALPPGSTVIHRPYSFYTQHTKLVWTVAAAFGTLVCLVLLLAINAVQRHRAQQAMRGLLEGSPDGVLVHDSAGRILYCNEVLSRSLGYRPGELLTKTTGDIDTPELAAGFQDRLARQFAIGKCSCEGWYVRKDGTRIPVDINTSLVRYEGRAAVLAVVRDITERKRAEEKLRESEARFRAAFVTNPDSVSITRLSDGVCVDVNDGFTALTGYTRQEILGRSTKELGLWQDPGDRDRAIAALNRDGLVRGVEVMIRLKDGRVRTFLLSANILTLQGEPHMLAMTRDITDLKNAEQEQRRLEAQVLHAQKLESLGVLAGGIAHDFNNLLVSILGNADLALMEMSEAAPAIESVREIRQAAIRASELTNQMLAYSGRGAFVVRAIDLNELVDEMGHLLRVSISRQTLLRYDLAANLPAVEADAAQVRQVVMNLITNAADAIGERSGVITISTGLLDATRDYLAATYLDEKLPPGPYVFLEVADTGCGMDAPTRARLFDPFFTTKFAGRGLGLAALLGIVRGHHGAVRVTSEVGKGTTFRVLLPCCDRPAERQAPPAPLPEATPGGGTVLIVDDEETVRNVARLMLQRFGMTVLTAADGKEGVDVFRQHHAEIDAVLLDMTMPRMSGEDAFRQMRDIRKDVRVVLCSGYNEQDATSRFNGQGLAGFLQKPFELHTLVGKIRQAIGKG